MGLLSGSLIYTPPEPEFSRYEPTGTWIRTAKNEVAYSNDGRNWQHVEYIGSTFWSTSRAFDDNGFNMMLPAIDIVAYTFKMTDEVTPGFTQSNNAPDPPEVGEEEDEWNGAQALAHGAGGWIGVSNGKLVSSPNGLDWNDETLPTNWGDAGGGPFRFIDGIELYFRLGSSTATNPDQYWTSGAGLSWVQRLFPEDFSGSTQFQYTDYIVGNDDDAVVVGLQSNGRIYRSTDGINWSLRHDPFPVVGLSCIAWNPMANNGAGAFFAVFGGAQPDNLLTSPDGIFWNPVDPNDLSISGDIVCDTGKNLMIISGDTSEHEPDFSSNSWMSDDDGETWKEFGDRNGGFTMFIDRKIGPVVDETLFINTGAIVISEERADPDLVRAALGIAGIGSFGENNEVRESTILGGNNVHLGEYAASIDLLNPFYYELRLDGSGDAFNNGGFPTAINEWVNASSGANWGYQLSSGVETRTFSGTLRVRDKETLVESNSVPVSITASVVNGATLSGVVATSAVGSVGFIPHGEAAISGVEATPAAGTPQGNISVEISGVEANTETGFVTPA